MRNAMRAALLLLLAAAAITGCVSVKNEQALVPPSALVTNFKAPLIVPKEPIPVANLKVGKGTQSVYVKEWIYSGASVDVSDMTLREAMANGHITRLLAADYEQYSILGFVTLFTVTAYGN